MTRRQQLRTGLRDYAIVATISIVILLVAFVAHRNHSFASEQQRRAHELLDHFVQRAELPEGAEGVWVATVATPQRSYLRTWLMWRPGDAAPQSVGGPNGNAIDKDLTSVAAAIESERASHTDDQGRVILATLANNQRPSGLAADAQLDRAAWVIRTPKAQPMPLPWTLLMLVLLGGAALVALVSGWSRFGVPAGLLLAGGVLAIPPLLWQQVAPALLITGVSAIAAVLHWRGISRRVADGFATHRVALAFVAPTALAMTVLVAVPFCVGLVLGFFDHQHGTWTFVGLRNFSEILSGGGHPLSDPLNFWFILGVTLLWTFANVFLHVVLGTALALLLSRSWLRGRGVLRMLLILPWAIPNYITALIWKGMFQTEYGAINSLLGGLGLDHVGWFSSWSTAFAANVTTNTWLGFPFMMVIAIGVLEGIPRDQYEAASIDGASTWQQFRFITLPHLRVGMAPAVALGTIWTFNMFNVIYLVSAGQPGGRTNILVTDAYKWAFERGERYGMAAAYATIIFVILLGWTWLMSRRRRRDVD